MRIGSWTHDSRCLCMDLWWRFSRRSNFRPFFFVCVFGLVASFVQVMVWMIYCDLNSINRSRFLHWLDVLRVILVSRLSWLSLLWCFFLKKYYMDIPAYIYNMRVPIYIYVCIFLFIMSAGMQKAHRSPRPTVAHSWDPVGTLASQRHQQDWKFRKRVQSVNGD